MQKKVEPVEGEPFRYWVESSDGGVPHLVDLFELSGNGECSCRDFEIRCLTNYRKNEGHTVDYGEINRTRCKHITTARLFLADQVIQEAHNESKKRN
jgi:hypothetical protein